MRPLLPVVVSGVLLLLSGCGGENEVAALPEAEAAAVPAMENVAVPNAAEAGLSLGCGAPFTRDATPATLAEAFGRENVIPDTVIGPEGVTLNVTAIFPNDPARRIEVVFRNEEERTDLSAVTVTSAGSLWTGPGGVKLGDAIDRIQTANGGHFHVLGFEWDHGGYVVDWKAGKLAGGDGCSATMRFSPDAETLPPELVGSDARPRSDLPAMRAAQPKVTSFGISWAQ